MFREHGFLSRMAIGASRSYISFETITLNGQVLLLSSLFSGRKQLFNLKLSLSSSKKQCSHSDNLKVYRRNEKTTDYDRNELEMFPIFLSICVYIL